jgi:hypothetical protein
LIRFVDCPTDAVLMDLHMPVMDGLQACQRMRQISQVPILIISTLNHPAVREQVFDCGANAFLPKPLALGPLLAWVRRVSEKGGGPASPAGRKPVSSPEPSPLPPVKPADPETGLRTWPPAPSVGWLPVSSRPILPICPNCSVPSRQVVQHAEKFDLWPPFGYTMLHGA